MYKTGSSKEFAKDVEEVLEDPPRFEGLTTAEVAVALNQPKATYRIHTEGPLGVLTDAPVDTKLFSLIKRPRASGRSK